jgi:hypothetical protein
VYEKDPCSLNRGDVGKSTGNDDVIKLLGEDCFSLITQVFKDVYENAEMYKDLTEVAMIALKNEAKGYKCSNHHSVSIMAEQNRIQKGGHGVTHELRS